MKVWQIIVVMCVVGVIGWGAWDLVREQSGLDSERSELSSRVEALSEENESLKESIEYYRQPENLLKELKSQFNYREEGEKLIILVPGTGGGTTSSKETNN